MAWICMAYLITCAALHTEKNYHLISTIGDIFAFCALSERTRATFSPHFSQSEAGRGVMVKLFSRHLKFWIVKHNILLKMPPNQIIRAE